MWWWEVVVMQVWSEWLSRRWYVWVGFISSSCFFTDNQSLDLLFVSDSSYYRCNQVHYRFIYSKRDGGWGPEWEGVVASCIVCLTSSFACGKNYVIGWVGDEKETERLVVCEEAAGRNKTHPDVPSWTYNLLQTCITTTSRHCTTLLHIFFPHATHDVLH